MEKTPETLPEKRKESLPPEEKEKYRQIYEIARDSLLEQLNRIEALEKKAQINLLVIGIVLSFGFFKTEAISNVFSGISIRDFVKSSQIVTLVVSFFCFIFSLIFSILALSIKDFHIYPDISQILEKFKDKRTEDLHISMSSHFQKSIQENEKALKSKTDHLKRSIRLILAAFIFSILFVIITVVSKALYLWKDLTMPQKIKKEEKKPPDVKKPEIIEIESKKVGYKRGERSKIPKGGKNDRSK